MAYRIKYLSAFLVIFLIVSILLPAGQVSAATYLTSVSVALNTVNPATAAIQTISFTTSASGGGVPLSSNFAITFPSSPNTWNISSIVVGDITLSVGGTSTGYGLVDGTSGAASQWKEHVSGQVMTFYAPTSGTPVIGQNTAVVITISSAHFNNPAAGTYVISIASGASDTGSATVIIASNVVNVSGTVVQNLTFSLTGTSVTLSPNPITTGGISTATSTFSLATNAPAGATVAETGASLTNLNTGGHTLTACSSGCGTANSTMPAAGTEAFGINLAANPSSFGAAPSCTGTCGTASTHYASPDLFWFNASGETITNVTAPINTTTYTISYLANISTVTPAGNYSTALTLTATATF